MTPAVTPKVAPAPAAIGVGCIAEGGGNLHARLRGSLDLDLDWANVDMLCDGELRPDGTGLRVSIAGPDRGAGRRVRLVFGISGVREGTAAQGRPTNLTLVFDGEQRIFSTRGDQNCVTDQLSQERLGTPGGAARRWRINGRGFCLRPAATIKQDARILVSRFDFTTQVTFRDTPAAPALDPPRPVQPARAR